MKKILILASLISSVFAYSSFHSSYHPSVSSHTSISSRPSVSHTSVTSHSEPTHVSTPKPVVHHDEHKTETVHETVKPVTNKINLKKEETKQKNVSTQTKKVSPLTNNNNNNNTSSKFSPSNNHYYSYYPLYGSGVTSKNHSSAPFDIYVRSIAKNKYEIKSNNIQLSQCILKVSDSFKKPISLNVSGGKYTFKTMTKNVVIDVNYKNKGGEFKFHLK